MNRPRLTSKVRRGLGNIATFVDVNMYEESDLLQSCTPQEEADTIRASEWLDKLIQWYDQRKEKR